MYDMGERLDAIARLNEGEMEQFVLKMPVAKPMGKPKILEAMDASWCYLLPHHPKHKKAKH